MRIIVLMGVSGCGKSTVGKALAALYGGTFLDGDDFHPPENVAKMRDGIPLTDGDRLPWLESLGLALREHAERGMPVFSACSALKRRYRDTLSKTSGGTVLFIHLNGSHTLISGRMAARKGHYMPPALLDSQFEALEPPHPDEHAVTVQIDRSRNAVIEECRHLLKRAGVFRSALKNSIDPIPALWPKIAPPEEQ